MKSILVRGGMVWRLARMFVAASLFPIPVYAAVLTPQKIFSQSSGAVAALEVSVENGKTSASATQIDARHFVTTCETLDTDGVLRLSMNSVTFNGKIKARDRARNLCLIEVEVAPAKEIAQQRQVPQVGSRVFAISNALGLGVGISEGIVSGVRHFPAGDYIQFTAPISPGSEGGALVDEQGRLLGIIDYQRRDGQNVNFASFAVWIDEIEQRSVANAENLARLDAGAALIKQQKWADLSAFSANWLQQQPDHPDALRLEIAAARGLKNATAELTAWTALSRVNPMQADVELGLGRVLLANGRYKEALELGKQLVAGYPEYANARLLLAQAQQLTGQLSEADASYRQAISMDAWLNEAYQGLAAMAQHRGDTATAIGIWSRLCGLYPTAWEPRVELAAAYLAADHAPRAYTTLEKLPEKDRNNANVWYWRGVTLARLGAPEAAATAYRKSLDQHLEPADMAWSGIGYAMAAMQRYPEAIAAFESARKINPSHDEWAYQLAINLKDGGRSGEALVIMASLVSKAPEMAQYWRQQGFILAVLDRSAEAIPALEHSLQLNSEQPKLWRVLIDEYRIAGRHADARAAYQKLRAINTQSAEMVYRSAILPYEGDEK